MAKESAGLLLYRKHGGELEVFLVHPGGPFWAKKDEAAWSVPKGELASDEDPLLAAQREFREETGHSVTGPFIPLGSVKQSGGKTVHVWAVEGECDPALIVSNTFEMEWPPRSGKRATFPEVDRADWFTLTVAAKKLHKGQVEFLTRLEKLLGAGGDQVRRMQM